MKVQYIDKFEYQYTPLYSNIEKSIEFLNRFGDNGWELIDLIKPESTGEQYKAILKRKITEVEV